MTQSSKCPEKKVNFKAFNAWLKTNQSVALDCMSARNSIKHVIMEAEVLVKKTQVLNICDFELVNRVWVEACAAHIVGYLTNSSGTLHWIWTSLL